MVASILEDEKLGRAAMLSALPAARLKDTDDARSSYLENCRTQKNKEDISEKLIKSATDIHRLQEAAVGPFIEQRFKIISSFHTLGTRETRANSCVYVQRGRSDCLERICCSCDENWVGRYWKLCGSRGGGLREEVGGGRDNAYTRVSYNILNRVLKFCLSRKQLNEKRECVKKRCQLTEKNAYQDATAPPITSRTGAGSYGGQHFGREIGTRRLNAQCAPCCKAEGLDGCEKFIFRKLSHAEERRHLGEINKECDYTLTASGSGRWSFYRAIKIQNKLLIPHAGNQRNSRVKFVRVCTKGIEELFRKDMLMQLRLRKLGRDLLSRFPLGGIGRIVGAYVLCPQRALAPHPQRTVVLPIPPRKRKEKRETKMRIMLACAPNFESRSSPQPPRGNLESKSRPNFLNRNCINISFLNSHSSIPFVHTRTNFTREFLWFPACGMRSLFIFIARKD
eukprot:284817345_5